MGNMNTGWTPTHATCYPNSNSVVKYDENGKLIVNTPSDDDAENYVINKEYAHNVFITKEEGIPPSQISREFSIQGDGVADPIGFDGSNDVVLQFILNTTGVSAGTYTKVTIDNKGRVIDATVLSSEDIPTLPSSKIIGLPTKLSQLTNDVKFQSEVNVDAKIAKIINSAPETLDTLKELSDALGNDPNFATTVLTEIGTKEILIKNASIKASMVDNDTIPLSDSAVSNATKKITFANIKASLKSYFDTLYNKYTHPTHTAKANGLYKIVVDAAGHVSGATTVVKTDITALGIPAQDTVYTHPAYTAVPHKLYKITVDAIGHVSATASVVKADITELGIPAQDTVYTHPTTAGNIHIPSGGTTGNLLTWSSNGVATWKPIATRSSSAPSSYIGHENIHFVY